MRRFLQVLLALFTTLSCLGLYAMPLTPAPADEESVIHLHFFDDKSGRSKEYSIDITPVEGSVPKIDKDGRRIEGNFNEGRLTFEAKPGEDISIYVRAEKIRIPNYDNALERIDLFGFKKEDLKDFALWGYHKNLTRIDELNLCTSLKRLRLGGLSRDFDYLALWNNMKALEFLMICDSDFNDFSEWIPATVKEFVLTNMPNLERVDLISERDADTPSALTKIYLGDLPKLDGDIGLHISDDFVNLEELSLRSLPLKDYVLNNEFPKLKVFSLVSSITESVSLPERLAQLEQLNLDRNKIKNLRIGTYPNLKEIELIKNQLSIDEVRDLIDNLPVIQGDKLGELRLLDFSTSLSNVPEGNQCNKEIAEKAKAKGWKIKVWRAVGMGGLVDYDDNLDSQGESYFVLDLKGEKELATYPILLDPIEGTRVFVEGAEDFSFTNGSLNIKAKSPCQLKVHTRTKRIDLKEAFGDLEELNINLDNFRKEDLEFFISGRFYNHLNLSNLNLKGCFNLKLLELYGLQDKRIDWLEDLDLLKSIDIWGTKLEYISMQLPESLISCIIHNNRSLREVNIKEANKAQETKLSRLIITGSYKLSDVILPKNLLKLEELYLSNNYLTNLEIGNYPKLLNLDISKNQLSKDQIATVIDKLPDLHNMIFDDSRDQPMLYIIDKKSDREGNQIPLEDVQKAVDKAWLIVDVNGSSGAYSKVKNYITGEYLFSCYIMKTKYPIGTAIERYGLNAWSWDGFEKIENNSKATTSSQDLVFCERRININLSSFALTSLYLNEKQKDFIKESLKEEDRASTLRISKNSLRGKEMSRFINSLPDISENARNSYVEVIDLTDPTEENHCTKFQVSKMKSKGWAVKALSNGELIDYEGSDETSEEEPYVEITVEGGSISVEGEDDKAYYKIYVTPLDNAESLPRIVGVDTEIDKVSDSPIYEDGYLSFKANKNSTFRLYGALKDGFIFTEGFDLYKAKINIDFKHANLEDWIEFNANDSSDNVTLSNLDVSRLENVEICRLSGKRLKHFNQGIFSSFKKLRELSIRVLEEEDYSLTLPSSIRGLDIYSSRTLKSLQVLGNLENLQTISIPENSIEKLSFSVNILPSLRNFYILLNKFSEEEIDALVGLLPSLEKKDGAELVVLDSQDPNEGNQMTQAIAQKAATKNWRVSDYNGDWVNRLDYLKGAYVNGSIALKTNFDVGSTFERHKSVNELSLAYIPRRAYKEGLELDPNSSYWGPRYKVLSQDWLYRCSFEEALHLSGLGLTSIVFDQRMREQYLENGGVMNIYIPNNALKGKEMDKFIESLPDISKLPNTNAEGEYMAGRRFVCVMEKDSPIEQNVCTKSQVAKIRAKGWGCVYRGNSKTTVWPYEGVEDPESYFVFDLKGEKELANYFIDLDPVEGTEVRVEGAEDFSFTNGRLMIKAKSPCQLKVYTRTKKIEFKDGFDKLDEVSIDLDNFKKEDLEIFVSGEFEETIKLSNLNLTGSSNIKTLRLSGLKDKQINWLEDLDLLENLFIMNTEIEQISIQLSESLKNFNVSKNKALTYLKIKDANQPENSNLDGDLYIQNNPMLRELSMPKYLPVRNIDLYRNALTSISLGDYPNLNRLDLSRNKLEELVLPQELLQLEQLYLSNNRLTKVEFGNYPKLFVLNISENLLLEDEIATIIDKLPDLHNREFDHWRQSPELVLIDKVSKTEGNRCRLADVQKAVDKAWIPIDVNGDFGKCKNYITGDYIRGRYIMKTKLSLGTVLEKPKYDFPWSWDGLDFNEDYSKFTISSQDLVAYDDDNEQDLRSFALTSLRLDKQEQAYIKKYIKETKYGSRLYISNNSLRGAEMDKFIESLPDISQLEVRNTFETAYIEVIDLTKSTEENVCTKSQVAKMKAKGWEVKARTEQGLVDYEGSEDIGLQFTVSTAVGEEISFTAEGEGLSYAGLEELGDNKYKVLKQEVTIFGEVRSLDLSSVSLVSLKLSEAESLRLLNCSETGLTSLDLSAQVELRHLNCEGNKLKSLNLEQNTKLQNLNCKDNDLEVLNLSQLPNLKVLDCSGNSLASLDLSLAKALVNLDCSFNKLTSLELKANTSLKALSCTNNKLTSLDLSANTLLERLFCTSNRLKNLDTSNNTKLRKLYCDKNQINSLAVNGSRSAEYFRAFNINENTELEDLNCSDNQLTELDLSHNGKLKFIDCSLNQIKGKKLVRLIESIAPRLEEVKDLKVVVVDKTNPKEGNGCSKKQVQELQKKKLKLYDKNGGNGLDDKTKVYEGEDEQTTALSELNTQKAFKYYPNPAKDFLMIEGLSANEELKVYSISGALVLQVETDVFGEARLDVSNLPIGFYIIQTSSQRFKFEVRH